jgi:hypothetical protein
MRRSALRGLIGNDLVISTLSNRKGGSMMDESDPSRPSGEPSHRNYDSRPIPDGMLAVFVAGLVVALVLGYLFLNKLVDISREEDCALAHRKNCAASESPTDR